MSAGVNLCEIWRFKYSLCDIHHVFKEGLELFTDKKRRQMPSL